jgi:ribosomal protein L37AE/L43A
MTDRITDRKLAWYVCGKCKHEIYRLKSEEDIIPCDECGAVMSGTTSSTSNTTTGKALHGGDEVEVRAWEHGTRKSNDMPSKIKLDLNNPNG